MTTILTADQMREVDRLTTARYGISSLQLMENAGSVIAAYLADTYPGLRHKRVLVLCGKGNNGGDGLVVARLLRERGAAPHVLLLAEPAVLRGDAATNLTRWQQMSGPLQSVTSLAEWEAARAQLHEYDLIVDALLGTGVTRPVEGLLAQVIEDINAIVEKFPAIHVISVDMPSGLPSGTDHFGGPIVSAHATVTLTAPKVGQMVNLRCDRVGTLIVRNIGTPASLLEDDRQLSLRWIEPGEFRSVPLLRKRDANKGSYGHALVVAGSLGKSGAAALAGRAALRAGAGLVTVATPLDVLPLVAASMPELMTEPLILNDAGSAGMQNVEYDRLTKLAAGKSVLAIGPGLSTKGDTPQFIRAVIAQTRLPVILDADSLNAFTGCADRLQERKTSFLAMTPHPGEMARLLGVSASEVQERRLSIALEMAHQWRAYIVLKGFHTIVATPDGRAFVNTTGNPGMATGGTGDVLTGILAGLTAEFGTGQWERILALGIYLHGLAGDLAAEKVGEAPLVASDLIDALPQAFARFRGEWERVCN